MDATFCQQTILSSLRVRLTGSDAQIMAHTSLSCASEIEGNLMLLYAVCDYTYEITDNSHPKKRFLLQPFNKTGQFYVKLCGILMSYLQS